MSNFNEYMEAARNSRNKFIENVAMKRASEGKCWQCGEPAVGKDKDGLTYCEKCSKIDTVQGFKKFDEAAEWKGETPAQRNPSMVKRSGIGKSTQQKQKPCPYCHGSGKEVEDEEEDNIRYSDKPCSRCDGTGKDIEK